MIASRLCALAFSRVARHHQDRQIGPVPGYLQGECNTVQLRHDDIRQQQVEFAGFQSFQRTQLVFGRNDLVAGIGERAGDEFANGCIVFSNQNF